MELIWILVAISLLQPVLQRRWLQFMRARKIAELERARGSRVILLVHRQETMSLLGIPLMRYIDIHDSEEVLRAIHLTDPELPLDIVLHTPGGLVLAAVQIARAVQAHKGRVTVFVPHHAMSGGTLIALAADEIMMCRHSVLGPIDPQVNGLPAASVLSAVIEKTPAEVDDQTLILADVARKAIAQVEAEAEALLSHRVERGRAREIARSLASGLWTHDYPIGASAAGALGLSVTVEMPEAVLNLMTLYPQPVRQQTGGVEYLPEPRNRRH